MLYPGRISKPQLFVVRKIIGDRNKLAKWQKMFVLTVTFTYFSFLPLSLVLLLLLFFTSATSACCGSLLSRVCCCVFDLSFFPPSPETFHLNILTTNTCHTLWYQSLSVTFPCVDKPAQSLSAGVAHVASPGAWHWLRTSRHGELRAGGGTGGARLGGEEGADNTTHRAHTGM